MISIKTFNQKAFQTCHDDDERFLIREEKMGGLSGYYFIPLSYLYN